MGDKLTINVDFNELPDNKKAVTDVYDLIAKAAGVNPDDVKTYDCTKMDYSLNAETEIYKKAGKEIDPVHLTIALAMSGMKVDKTLPDNTAVIYRGGIVMEDGRDLLDVVGIDKPVISENNSFEQKIDKLIAEMPKQYQSKGGQNHER